jgi:hypothetical protein
LRQIFSDHLFHFAISRDRNPCLSGKGQVRKCQFPQQISDYVGKLRRGLGFGTKPAGKQVFLDRLGNPLAVQANPNPPPGQLPLQVRNCLAIGAANKADKRILIMNLAGYNAHAFRQMFVQSGFHAPPGSLNLGFRRHFFRFRGCLDPAHLDPRRHD